MIEKLRQLNTPTKFTVMLLWGMVLTVMGWSYNNTPLMLYGLVLFLGAGWCYSIAYKLLMEIIKGDTHTRKTGGRSE